ncbi:MAG TPA: CoA-binding protein, partial [bacterium]|nr:CoA-binding protein [bacterium]
MNTTNDPDVRYLFEPRSIAIVGASSNKAKIGFKIVDNIVSGNYAGKIYPVNPGGGEVLGLKMYKSLAEIEGDVDLVCISIPAKQTFECVKE